MTHIYDQPEIKNQNTETNFPPPSVYVNSAVSWGAIFAGAVAAASLALIMLMLGAGLGLTSISPWGNHGVSAETVGIATIAWLTFTQIVASGMGGYLAGRLRTKRVDVHTDEIYFRDTAHGFLTWAVASLISAMLLTTTVGSILGGSAKVVGSIAGGATTAASVAGASGMDRSSFTLSGSPMEYFIHSMFRTGNTTSTDGSQPAPQQDISAGQLGEVTGIFANSISSGSLPQEDLQYVSKLIAQHTGISQQEAEQRVQTSYEKVQMKLKEAKVKAQQAADTARKTTSYVMLWTFISLLIGAFIASLSATFGGRQRDL